MKKMQGFVDPISLSVVVLLGIAVMGTVVTGNSADEQQQLAQNSEAEQTAAILADN